MVWRPFHLGTRAAGVIARIGYASMGVVYLWLGAVISRSGFRQSGPPNAFAAFRAVKTLPFGYILLAALAVGLLTHSIWHCYKGACGVRENKGVIGRAYAFGNGIFSILWALSLIEIAAGFHHFRHEDEPALWAAKILSQPGGREILAAFGLCLIGKGLFSCARLFTKPKGERMDHREIKPGNADWITLAGGVGRATRGFISVFLGWYILRAAYLYRPGEAQDIAGALTRISRMPEGNWILVLVGIGLAIYGAYFLLYARFRKPDPVAG